LNGPGLGLFQDLSRDGQITKAWAGESIYQGTGPPGRPPGDGLDPGVDIGAHPGFSKGWDGRVDS